MHLSSSSSISHSPPQPQPSSRSTRIITLLILTLTLTLVQSPSQAHAQNLSTSLSTPDTPRPCAPGLFDNGIECEHCPPGTFSLSEHSFICGPCPPGHGVPLFDIICQQCQPGTYSMQPGPEPCDVCLPGYYSDEPGAIECKKCPEGTFSSGADATSPDSCTVCPPGWRWAYVADKTADCLPCEPGHTSTEDNSETCTPCPAGTFQEYGDAYEDGGDSSVCRPCPAGTFSAKEGSVSCEVCPEGAYQNEVGATECKNCPEGSQSDLYRSTHCRSICQQGADGCKSCGAGRGLDSENGTCKACASGSVNWEERIETECVVCDAAGGQVADEEAKKCVCDEGLVRKEGDDGELICEKCPKGATSKDGKECLCTGEGMYMHYGGFCDCVPGTKLVDGKCVECSAEEIEEVDAERVGYWSDMEMYGDLDDDSYDEFVEPEGAEEQEVQEEEGQGMEIMEEEYVEPASTNECALCGVGHGLSASGVCCLPCMNGTANIFTNLHVCSGCPGTQTASANGTECVCEAGHEKTASGCRKCPAGKFANGGVLQDVCTACWPGTFSKEGSGECTVCADGMVSGWGAGSCMAACPENAELDEKSGECVCKTNAIEKGRDDDAGGGVVCEACPGIEVADSSRTECMCMPGEERGVDGVCRWCAVGSAGYGDEGGCKLCEVGSAANIEGQAYSCQPCADGTEAVVDGMSECLPVCEQGTFRGVDGLLPDADADADARACQTCELGQRMVNRSCVACAQGSVSGGGAAAFCEACNEEAGLVADGGGGKCVRGGDGGTPCAAGTFLDKSDGNKCKACGAGSFSTGLDASSCTPCAKGSFRATEGGAECSPCAAGSVAPEAGMSECVPCADGLFQDRTGQAVCARCADGRKVADGGAACVDE